MALCVGREGGWRRWVVGRFSLPGLPGPRSERVRLGCERPHGADVNDVARELRHEHFLHIGANLQVIASTGGAQVLHPGDLAGKAEQRKPSCDPASLLWRTRVGSGVLPNAARALDTACHDGLDERPDVFVLHCPLALRETTAV